MKSDPKIEASRDFFSYFIAYFPEFPVEDQMDGSRALDILMSGLEHIQTVSADPIRLQWLELCKNELHEAAQAIAQGDTNRAETAVISARELFENLLARKLPKPDFVAHENGKVEKV